MKQEKYLVVFYTKKTIINVKPKNCGTQCKLCLSGNDCYSDYESVLLRHLQTKHF